MSIHLPPEQETELRHLAEAAGRDADELAAEIVGRYLDEQSRRAELVALIEEGERDIERGAVIEFETADELGALFEQIKREGAARLDAQGEAAPGQQHR